MVRKYFIFISILFSSYSYADSNDGLYGYYWSAGSNLLGSTSYQAAMAECALYAASNPSCVGVSLQSSGATYAYYKRVLSNGGLSSVQVSVVRSQCTSSTSNIASCQQGYGAPQLCSDGFPPDLLGYYGCDRPALKQCSDGSYVNKSSFCPLAPQVCSDYDTCYNYALNGANCTGSTYFEFNYTNPQNFSFECSVIEASSPDNLANGGNADGNPDNDPTSPVSPTVSELDPTSLSNAIDSSLQDNFGNVERAIRESGSGIEDSVRDGTSKADQNAQAIKDALNGLGVGTGQGFTDLKTAINNGFLQLGTTTYNGSSNIVGSVNGVKNSVDAGNVTLSQISGKLDQLKECEPTVNNNYCENPHGLDSSYVGSITDAIQGTFEQEKTSAIDTVKDEINDIKNNNPFSEDLPTNELYVIWGYFTNIWPAPSECVPLVFGNLSKPWGVTITCKFSESFKSVFSWLIAIYTIHSLVDILFSGIRPKPFIDK